MLPAIRNVPRNEDEWNLWAWDHKASHDRIRQKIQQQLGPNLPDYQIEPISQQGMDVFLDNNAALHSEMNSALGLVSEDLTDVDIGDKNQLEAWVGIHYLEHFNAESKVGA